MGAQTLRGRGRWRTTAVAAVRAILIVGVFMAGVAVGSAGGTVAPRSAGPEPDSTPTSSEPTPIPTAFQSPSRAPSPATDPVLPGLPECHFADIRSPEDPDAAWATILLDTIVALPASYGPRDLVDTSSAGLNGGHLVRSIVVPDLRAMVRAARRAGVVLAVLSGHRSYAEQEQTFAYWLAIAGRDEALRRSARPGHSEHQLGTAIDFRSATTGTAPWKPHDWVETHVGGWLHRHAWRFGFVMSYPRHETARTCYGYEPWHYRYFGRRVAGAIHASGLTPREWLWAESARHTAFRDRIPR